MRRFATALLESTGRSYELDSALPTRDLVGEIASRAAQLARGILRLRRRVFLGAGVRVRGRNRLALGRGVSIGARTLIDARGRRGVVLADSSRLGAGGVITTTSRLSLYGVGFSLGRNSGVGDGFHLGSSGGITIGDNVIVGPQLFVHSQEHNYDDPSVPIRDQGTVESAVVVGDDCWIGSRVTLLAGTVIGPRTVIASGSVVKGVHEGNEILAGTPARRVRAI